MKRECRCGKELINLADTLLVCPECDFPDNQEMQTYIKNLEVQNDEGEKSC